MKLSLHELARLDAMTAEGRGPPVPPPLPGLGTGPTSLAALVAYRGARLR